LAQAILAQVFSGKYLSADLRESLCNLGSDMDSHAAGKKIPCSDIVGGGCSPLPTGGTMEFAPSEVASAYAEGAGTTLCNMGSERASHPWGEKTPMRGLLARRPRMGALAAVTPEEGSATLRNVDSEGGAHAAGEVPPSPGNLVRRRKPRPSVIAVDFSLSPVRRPKDDSAHTGRHGAWNLSVKTPSSCASMSWMPTPTPCTPEPSRDDLRVFGREVGAILFDFDGTLTASKGEVASRLMKRRELCARAQMLAPRLMALRSAGITLGILSKSSESTIREALRESGLEEAFDGPILGNALGLEGKAGLIQELVRNGPLGHCTVDAAEDVFDATEAAQRLRVLLVDDDVRELARAREKGIHTYPAPEEGGLQAADFEQLFACLLPQYPNLGPAASLVAAGQSPHRAASRIGTPTLAPCHAPTSCMRGPGCPSPKAQRHVAWLSPRC